VDYDIFLSHKSEDHVCAKRIYDFLSLHGYAVFFAEPELKKNGNSIYGKIIDDALEASEHFILFATQKEFITSSYVENEWRTFVEEKRSGRKGGNIITILDGIEISALPIALRQFQSFQLDKYDEILDFLPKKTRSAALETFTQKINYILSEERLSEKIYADFREECSTTCSNGLIAQIKSTIKGIINDVETNGRQLKKSEFVSLFQELPKEYLNHTETYSYNLAREIIIKHCEDTIARVGGLLFKLYYSGSDLKLQRDKFQILGSLDIMFPSMALINNQNSFESFDTKDQREEILKLIITSALFPYTLLMPFMSLLRTISVRDENISLSQIKEIYEKYAPDTKEIKARLAKIIDDNDQIKLHIHEVIKSF
jgi:hypothetical protein